MLLCWLVMPIYSAAEEYVITGYGSEETAVKGDVEKQANKMIKSWGKKKPVKIFIQGFADKTGKTAENDSIARVRASEMEAFINERVDAGKITARSKGDSEDARKVIVKVEFVVGSAKELVLNVILIGAVVIFLIILFYLAVRLIRSKKEKEAAEKAEKVEWDKLSPKNIEKPQFEKYPETSVSNKPVEVTIDGQKYNFYPEIATDGRFKTCYEIENGRYMFVSTDNELRKSLKSSFNKDKGLFQRLIDETRKDQVRLELAC